MNTNQTCISDSDLRDLSRNQFSDRQIEQFESHLTVCGACREKLDAIDEEPHPLWDLEIRPAIRETFTVLDSITATGEGSSHESLLQLLTPSDDPAMLGRVGVYEVVGIVGQGGMGVVFKAFEPALNRFVAIKMLLPHLTANGAARKRFLREAQAAAAVVDDHVLPIFGVDEWQGTPYLVMKYSSGQTLEQRIHQQGPLALKEVLRISVQAARGLAAAHAQGLVHRDVKPSNILLDGSVDRAVLMDFGLARTVNDASVTRTGIVSGTPQYMSPEQVEASSVEPRSDLFSLGSVMYAMCAGYAPFRGDSAYAVMHSIAKGVPTPIREVNSDVTEWLGVIIERLMSKDASDRFGSADEVAQLLEDCLAHVQDPTRTELPTALKQAAGGGSSWRKWLAIACGGMLTLLLGVVITIELNKGKLIIESDVDDIPIRIMRGDQLVESLTVFKAGQSTRVSAGNYVIEVDGDFPDIRIDKQKVSLSRGERSTITITQADAPSTGKPMQSSEKVVAFDSDEAFEPLLGTWLLVEQKPNPNEPHGSRRPQGRAFQMTFSKNAQNSGYSVRKSFVSEHAPPSDPSVYRVTLNAAPSPKQINIFSEGVLIQGVYECKGNELRIAYNGKPEVSRASSLDATPNSDPTHNQWILKRVSPTSDEQSTAATPDLANPATRHEAASSRPQSAKNSETRSDFELNAIANIRGTWRIQTYFDGEKLLVANGRLAIPPEELNVPTGLDSDEFLKGPWVLEADSRSLHILHEPTNFRHEAMVLRYNSQRRLVVSSPHIAEGEDRLVSVFVDAKGRLKLSYPNKPANKAPEFAMADSVTYLEASDRSVEQYYVIHIDKHGTLRHWGRDVSLEWLKDTVAQADSAHKFRLNFVAAKGTPYHRVAEVLNTVKQSENEHVSISLKVQGADDPGSRSPYSRKPGAKAKRGFDDSVLDDQATINLLPKPVRKLTAKIEQQVHAETTVEQFDKIVVLSKWDAAEVSTGFTRFDWEGLDGDLQLHAIISEKRGVTNRFQVAWITKNDEILWEWTPLTNEDLQDSLLAPRNLIGRLRQRLKGTTNGPVSKFVPPEIPSSAVLVFESKKSGHGSTLAPVIDALHLEGYPVVRIDVDLYPELAEKYKAITLPNLTVLRNAREVAHMHGGGTPDMVRRFVEMEVALFATPRIKERVTATTTLDEFIAITGLGNADVSEAGSDFSLFAWDITNASRLHAILSEGPGAITNRFQAAWITHKTKTIWKWTPLDSDSLQDTPLAPPGLINELSANADRKTISASGKKLLSSFSEVEANVARIVEERKQIRNGSVQLRLRSSGDYVSDRRYDIWFEGNQKRSDCRGVSQDGSEHYTHIVTPNFGFYEDHYDKSNSQFNPRDPEDAVPWGNIGCIPNIRKIGMINWTVESVDNFAIAKHLLPDGRNNIRVETGEQEGQQITIVKMDRDLESVDDAWTEYWLSPAQGNYPIYIASGWTDKDSAERKYVISQRTNWKLIDGVWFPQNIDHRYRCKQDDRDDGRRMELISARFNLDPFPEVFDPLDIPSIAKPTDSKRNLRQ